MFEWFKNLFKRKTIEVVDFIEVKDEELKNPLIRPNSTIYIFPNPIKLKSISVKFRLKKKRKRKKK